MLFDIDRKCFESEKERNLYTKFFAGYLLNDLIEGYQQRVEALCVYLSQKSQHKIILKDPHISFDNHAYLFNIETDRGEFADILLHDVETKILIAIEAKYHTNFDPKKDFDANLKRTREIQTKLADYEIHNFLLLPETKWAALKKMKERQNSNFKKHLNHYSDKVHIIFWEDLSNLVKEIRVKNYMQHMLSLVNEGADKRKYEN